LIAIDMMSVVHRSMTVNMEVDMARSVATPPADLDTALCCAPLTTSQLSGSEASELASVFAALGDPVRLRLLSIVASEKEVCSCHLEAPLAKSQPTISHHTKVLSDAGLIVGEKRGRWTWWRVDGDRMRQLRSILGG
jgi:ArsR family transcriptional regulator